MTNASILHWLDVCKMLGLITHLCSLRPHRDDEHTLILQYCQTLGGESSPYSQPQSPAQILQAVEREERGELERIIGRLEEEQRWKTCWIGLYLNTD